MADEFNPIPGNENNSGQTPLTASAQPTAHQVEITEKTSGFAVAGLVLGILAILGAWIPLLNFLSIPFALVGLALAIVGTISTVRGRRNGKGVAIAGLILSALSLVLIFGMYGGAAAVSGSSSGAKSSSSAAAAVASSESASAESASSASESASAVSESGSSEAASAAAEASEPAEEPREFEVSVEGVRKGKDYAGEPIVIVTYAWMNNSDDTTSFAVEIYPKVFQNGVECDTAITTEIDSGAYMADVKPGYGTTVELAYHITDDSDVTIEIAPLINFSRETWFEGTFALQ